MPRYGWYVERTDRGIEAQILREIARDERKGRLHGTTLAGRDMRLNPRHLLLEWNSTRNPERLLESLAGLRTALDLDLLLEAAPRGTPIGLDELARLYYGDGAGPEERIALFEELFARPELCSVTLRGSEPALRLATAEERERAEERRRGEATLEAAVSSWTQALRGWEDLSAPPPGLDAEELDRLAGAAADHYGNRCQEPAFHETRRRLEESLGPEQAALLLFRLVHLRRGMDELEMHLLRLRATLPAHFAPAAPAAIETAIAAAERMRREAEPFSAPVFTVDDAGTRDFDDALSCQVLPGGRVLLGVHVAAAAAALEEAPELEARARDLAVSVYLPQGNLPMIPRELSEGALSLVAGEERLAVSYFFTLRPGDFAIEEHRVALQRLVVTANLTYDELAAEIGAELFPGFDEALGEEESLRRLNAADLPAGLDPGPAGPGPAWAFLAALARRRFLERLRRSGSFILRREFKVRADAASGRVTIKRRPPLQLPEQLVAEAMILVNEAGGTLLAESGVEAIYRAQAAPAAGFRGFSRSTITTRPEGHGALGVGPYAWQTSPIRRYVDYENQRQLLHLVRGSADHRREPNYLLMVAKDTDERLREASRAESTFTRYWVLRHLRDEGIETLAAEVREGRRGLLEARALDFPLTFPLENREGTMTTGERVAIRLLAIDLVNLGVDFEVQ